MKRIVGHQVQHNIDVENYLRDISEHLASIATSLAEIAAGPYRPLGKEVLAVRDAAGSSTFAAHDALVLCKGNQDAAVQHLKNKR